MKSKKRINPDVRKLVIGAAIGITVFLLISLMAAFVLTKKDLSFPVIRYVMIFGVSLSAFSGGYISKRKNRFKGIVCGLFSGVAVLLAAGVLLLSFNGLEMIAETLLLIPLSLIFGVTGGIVCSNLR